MYLLVDSGSTKADWVLFDNQISYFFVTNGINSSTQKEENIQNTIGDLRNQLSELPDKIYFYGAGVSSPAAKLQLDSAFRKYFPDSTLSIYSDLLAAGRALCNGQEAIICILGTGSHAALCNGHEIIHELPSLGYLLGDEGSGNHLGKEILKAYFYQKLDSELKLLFENKHPEVLSDFIYKLYQSKNISPMLANYGRFVIENKMNPICNQIITRCLESFIMNKLEAYNNKSYLPVHLCGSIAYYLKDELEICLQNFGFHLGECIQKPIHKLLEYYKREV